MTTRMKTYLVFSLASLAFALILVGMLVAACTNLIVYTVLFTASFGYFSLGECLATHYLPDGSSREHLKIYHLVRVRTTAEASGKVIGSAFLGRSSMPGSLSSKEGLRFFYQDGDVIRNAAVEMDKARVHLLEAEDDPRLEVVQEVFYEARPWDEEPMRRECRRDEEEYHFYLPGDALELDYFSLN